MQAQERSSALWALGLRTGAAAPDIEDVVASGRIVRTWLLRGTLHIAAPGDVRWLLDLIAPRLIARSARRDAQLKLDLDTYRRSAEVLTTALDRGPLSRSGVMSALEDAGITTGRQRGYHILWRLALEQRICFGPMAGREPTFVLLDSVVPPAPAVDRDRALAKLALRYFEGHGPAGLQDLVWWSGIAVGEARRAIEAASPALQREDVNGTSLWSASSSSDNGGPRGHLLPAFDEYIIGYRDRGAVLEARHTQQVLSSNGVFHPVLVVDGRARGTWRVKRGKKSIKVEAMPFSSLTPSEQESLEEAAERYARFTGLPVTFAIAGR
jgi:hypothetical protein